LKKQQIKWKAKSEQIAEEDVVISNLQCAINGSVAGSIAGLIVTPFDVLKTRAMTNSLKNHRCTTLFIVKNLYATEGVRGFYKGGMIRAFTLCAGGFAFFGIYEYIHSEMIDILNDV
jgi:solute carrier family 25 (mitochondrial S-adenosylmethionine transporter), member 26